MNKTAFSANGPARLPVSIGLAASLAILMFSYSVFASVTGQILPTSDGNYTQWTPSTGTSHFAMVDETVCNGTTDFNSARVVGNRDSYGVSLTSVPNGSTITQIDINPCASRAANGGAAPVIDVFYRTNGVNSADSGSYSLTGTTPVELATTTFSGLSVVKTLSTTLESGVVLTSSSVKGARLSRITTTITYTPLTAPSNLSGGSGSSAVFLTWTDTSSNESGFNVERSTDGISWVGVATTSANATSYNDSGLSALTTYYHRVRAYNSGAYTSFSNVSTTTTNDVAPPAPSGLSATASQTLPQVSLTWADNASNETSFEVLRSLDGSSFSHLATTSANAASYTDSAVTASTMYYYQVRAYNGSGYSAVSNASTTTTGQVPFAPSGLSAVASTSVLRIDLTWADNSTNELNMLLERSTTSPSSGFVSLATLESNVTSYADTTLTEGTTYYYRVAASNGYGQSSYSSTASAVSASSPAAPTDLSTFASSTSEIGLSWADNSSNEIGFKIERRLGTGAFSQIATRPANWISYLDWGLTPGTYVYRVRAYNSIGNSAFSNESTTTVP